MDQFPPELHSYICQLACTDAGSTVHSLSLVSSYFREIARQFLFQSISVTGIEQLTIITTKLESTPANMRGVRHLYISDRDFGASPSTSTTPGLNPNATFRLLDLVRPTLETLTLNTSSVATSSTLLGRLFRTTFPKLRELTVSGFYPFPSKANTFPSLTHLHLIGNRNPHGLFSVGGMSVACPALTHLRVSGLNTAMSFANELEKALRVERDISSLFPVEMPPKIRHVHIQAGPVPSYGGSASLKQKDLAMMQKLQDLVTAKGLSAEVVLHARGLMDHKTTKQNWLDRLDDGLGCWCA